MKDYEDWIDDYFPEFGRPVPLEEHSKKHLELLVLDKQACIARIRRDHGVWADKPYTRANADIHDCERAIERYRQRIAELDEADPTHDDE